MTLHLDLRRAARVGVALSVAALGLVLAATPAWAAVPDAPTITSVTRGNAQISVAFTPGGNGGFPVLTFEATCTSSDGGVTGSTTGVASPLAVTGLTNGKTYTCTVIATNVIGNSAPSAPSDAIVPATVPSAPTITSATAGDARITVAFTPGSDGGGAITSFSASCTSLDGGAAGSQTGSGSPIAVTILTNAKTYTCTVTATNAVGTSAASLPSTPAVPGAAPDAPTITIVVPDDAQIAVGFTPGNDHGFPVITFTATCTSSNGGAPRCAEPLSTTQKTRRAAAYGARRITCATSASNDTMPFRGSQRPTSVARCTSHAARYTSAPARTYSCSTRMTVPGPGGRVGCVRARA